MTKDTYPQAEQRRKTGLSVVWLLPLIAAGLALWLLYQNMQSSGLVVTVHFDDGSGITAGKTPVVYQGITVGTVSELALDDDLDGVIAKVELQLQIEPLIRKDTRFWLVKPQISLSGVSGLDTLVAGNYISFQPGEGEPATEFRALTEPPPFAASAPGLPLTLKADTLGSLTVGAPVLFQQIDVGDVEGYQLTDEGVEIALRIQPRYQHLVNQHSRFWNASGVRINAGLQGVAIETGSLASVISGGVAFDSPSGGGKVDAGMQFKLYDSRERARGGRDISLHFPSAEGLSIGTELRLNGIGVGRIDELAFTRGNPLNGVDATLRVYAPYDQHLNGNSAFWLVSPQISSRGVEGLDTLIGGPYIAWRTDGGPGTDKAHYTALREPPEKRIEAPGLRVVLRADDLGSVSVGSKVLFKKIPVGEVETIHLQRDGVDIGVFIHDRYRHLVGKESLFWNASGVSISGGLGGLDIKTESVTSILSGGIAFHTPEVRHPKAAWNGLRFTLHKDYDSTFADKGREISIYLSSGTSINKGTEIKYQGIKVGEVIAVELDSSMKGVMVTARLTPSAKSLAREGSRFWVVKPQLGLVGTRNLETLVTGAYISVSPGAGKQTTAFIGLDHPPHLRKPDSGLNLVLSAPSRGSIKEGVKVFYRDIPVGEVFGYELAEDAQRTLIHINIEPRYATLVRHNSKFWNSSGIAVKFGLFSGTTIRSKSVESLLEGGIAFATPPGKNGLAPPAESSQHFPLHKEVESHWLEWSPRIPLTAVAD